MDPNETLKQLRDMGWTAERFHLTVNQSKEFAALFRALDQWICNGGFLPIPWERNRPGQ